MGGGRVMLEALTVINLSRLALPGYSSLKVEIFDKVLIIFLSGPYFLTSLTLAHHRAPFPPTIS